VSVWTPFTVTGPATKHQPAPSDNDGINGPLSGPWPLPSSGHDLRPSSIPSARRDAPLAVRVPRTQPNWGRGVRLMMSCDRLESRTRLRPRFAVLHPPLGFVRSGARASNGTTSLPSRFVPSTCPSECETRRNSVVQRLRKRMWILASELDICAFSIVIQSDREGSRSDLKSVRSPDRRRS
jgi:hypothetical protein